MSRSEKGYSLLPIRICAIFLSILLLSCAGKKAPQVGIEYPIPTPPPATLESSAPSPQPSQLDQSPQPPQTTPFVVVKLLETAESLVIRPIHADSLDIRCVIEGVEVSNYRSPSSVSLSLEAGRIVLHSTDRGIQEKGLGRVSFSPVDESASIYLNDRPYRGDLFIIPKPTIDHNGTPEALVVLNVIHIEEYLRGVVPGEIGNLGREEIEAIKAQAVAARTYAYSRLGQFVEWGYDLEATVKDQLYLGVEGENPLADEAIVATKGMVMTHDGLPIQAYYHANCGGGTEYIERIWDKPPRPYLVPAEDAYCEWAPSYRWEETWRPEDLVRNISAYIDTVVTIPGSGLGTLLDLRIASRSPSGRVESLEAVTSSGTYTIPKDRIRWAMKRGSNPNRLLRSTLFDLELVRGKDGKIQRIMARGFGTGHGVGMCQTGAIGMARQGYSWEAILMHYYHGAELQAH